MACHVMYCMNVCTTNVFIYIYLSVSCAVAQQREKSPGSAGLPIDFVITWAQQVPMSHEYDLLLQTFLNNEGMDEAHLHHMASHGTTMLAILATGGRGEFPVLKMPYSQVEKNVHNNSGGWTSIGRIFIDHY